MDEQDLIRAECYFWQVDREDLRAGLVEILSKFTSKSTNSSRKRSQKCTLSLSTESAGKKYMKILDNQETARFELKYSFYSPGSFIESNTLKKVLIRSARYCLSFSNLVTMWKIVTQLKNYLLLLSQRQILPFQSIFITFCIFLFQVAPKFSVLWYGLEFLLKSPLQN